MQVRSSITLTASTEEHEAIIRALIASDADRLEEALNLNWENAANGSRRSSKFSANAAVGERGSDGESFSSLVKPKTPNLRCLESAI